MALDINGKLHKVFDIEQKTDTFKTREFVIQTDGEYPQFVKFQITQDRVSLVDNFNEGDVIKVHFDLRGREWQGKYFTNLNAWKIENANGAQGAAPQQEENFNQETSNYSASDASIDAREDLDDLPF
ncbi:MAG: DUF3127 domain-containing protein [Chitinophagales bacterium]|nr:DUF3127 domain-containing protein [Chitinophagales bacterium]